MIRLSFRAALLAAALALPALAQVQAFGMNSERAASTRVFMANGAYSFVCVQYGQPMWKDSYDAMAETMKGTVGRLGKDFWTTFNTSIALNVGGADVAPGAYYLAIACDKEGKWSLLVIDAVTADKHGWNPLSGDALKAVATCPLTKGVAEDSVEKLSIDISGQSKEPTAFTFNVAWGTHTLTAPVTAKIAAGEAKGTGAAAAHPAPVKK
ncbi:MAG: DUF2911 domain-containing protein [Planctomycetes bacterium]|nr:DUF2911 domain-containing protein [Planctomycetota bacterium]